MSGRPLPADAAPDPLATAAPGNIAETYARLREMAPVYWSQWFGGWVVTRYADTVASLRDPALGADDPLARLDRLGSRGGPSLDNFRAVLSTISFFMNPPRHDEVRRFLAQVFQGLDLAGLRAALNLRAASLLRAGRAAGSIDLADGFARDLALFTIHRLLGIPLADCIALAAMAREVADFFDLGLRPLRRLVAADAKLGELLAYFARLIAQRRQAPADDGLSLMIGLAERQLGVSDLELAGFCAFFFVAGEETTATGIAASTVILVEQPGLLALLAAAPARVPDAARELLRLSSPFQYVTRIAATETMVGGQTVRRGQTVHLILAAANRDPAVFAAPDTVDLDRDGAEAMPFGYGAYRCLGAKLATLELEAAIGALVCCPDLHLGPAPVVWESRTRVPALAHVPASFRPAGSTDQPA